MAFAILKILPAKYYAKFDLEGIYAKIEKNAFLS